MNVNPGSEESLAGAMKRTLAFSLGPIIMYPSMKERKYVLEYIVIETDVFARDHGTLSQSERERLYFDLMQGNGEIVPETGGLKRIRCGLGGYLGTSKEGWEVVFADYTYADIQKRFFWLLFKSPPTLDKTLSEPDREELRQLKARADHCMSLYYERLQEGGVDG
jgi:hypothetical protein